MAVSSDAQKLVVVVEGLLDPIMCSMSTQEWVGSFRGHSGLVTCLHITTDNRLLVSGSEDLSVIVWDLGSTASILRIR